MCDEFQMLLDVSAPFKAPLKTIIGVVGLGYVGLPLLVELSKNFESIGYDINQQRVSYLQKGLDTNREIDEVELKESSARFSSLEADLKFCNLIIVTVPTPVDAKNHPDLMPLKKAMSAIARHIKKNDIIVLESTVYPGVTENICGAILQEESGLVCNRDFFIGYSPERVNPGDRTNTISRITKVVSAQNNEVLNYLADVYGSINNQNIFKAKTIKAAEAAKVIENAQRDINIAFINEITKILNSENIQIYDVLEASRTKWNFLDFKPGLVGGHCIGVDPYYLTFYSDKMGVAPDVIAAGRAINDSMSEYISGYITKNLRAHNKDAKKILLLGFSFKENVNDVRNTKVYELYCSLKAEGFDVDIYDPLIKQDHLSEYPNLIMQDMSNGLKYDLVALCVPHNVFSEKRDYLLSSFLNEDGVIFDLKAAWKSDVELGILGNNYFTL